MIKDPLKCDCCGKNNWDRISSLNVKGQDCHLEVEVSIRKRYCKGEGSWVATTGDVCVKCYKMFVSAMHHSMLKEEESQ